MFLENYLKKEIGCRTSAGVAYLATLNHLMETFPSVGLRIIEELQAQRSRLKMIASENYSSLSVQLAMGNLLTDKYAEGIPFHRFYAGCEQVDALEWECAETAKELFNAEYANVQPHSGADANLIALLGIITSRVQLPFIEKLGRKGVEALSSEEYQALRKEIGDRVCLGPSLNSGGHLTHGSVRLNIVSKLLHCESYDINPETELFDYDVIALRAKETKPLIIIAGYSSYSRRLNFAILKQIAEDVGAVLWADMAHFAGLVAGGVFRGEENPIPYSDVITATTHKTLRGPRGGLILAKKEFGEVLNKGCPMVMGGPLPHVIAAKLIAFKEALTLDFKAYAHNTVKNAMTLAQDLQSCGLRVLTGGTENHMVIIDLRSTGISGRIAENFLSRIGIIVNRNSIPFDTDSGWHTSGVRLGLAALTTLGMGVEEMHEIADIIATLIFSIK
ncbi:MAG: hypothetical protein RR733_00655, partial [Victivallaceae bacterium]